MCVKALLVTFALILQVGIISSQRQWVPPTTTAAEMWNPYTWYWPYAIAASEGYRDWYVNAQQITNQLYQQAYATQAFWWTRPPGAGPVQPGGNVPQQPGGNVPQQPGGNVPQQPGGNVPQQPGGNVPQQPGGNVPQQPGGNVPQQPGGNVPQQPVQQGRPVANMAQGGSGWA